MCPNAIERVGDLGAAREIVSRIDDALIGVGYTFFVNSAGTHARDDAAHGDSWVAPFATIDYAIGHCVANRGDVIEIAPMHTETRSAASAIFDADVAGITLRGHGHGSLRPTLNYNHASAVCSVGASNVSISGIIFKAHITSVTKALDIEATVTGTLIEDCQFTVDTAGTDEFTSCVNINDSCDDTIIRGCLFAQGVSGAAAQAILLTVAATGPDGVIIEDCTLTGSFSTGFVGFSGDFASTNFVFRRNLSLNTTANKSIVTLYTGSTGYITDNRFIQANTTTKAFTADAVVYANNHTLGGSAPGIRVDRATAAIPQTTTADLFTVATGRVRVYAILGKVTTNIGAVANATKFTFVPTAGIATRDLCATLEWNALAAGNIVSILGAPATAMVASYAAVLGAPLLLEPGTVKLDCAGSDGETGRAAFELYYEPVEAGASVVSA